MSNKKNNMDEENLSPEQSIIKTISEAGMRDTGFDIAEVFLDDKLLENLQDETLSNIPIIKSIYSLVKSGIAVRDYLFLKKILYFISGFKEVDDEFRKSLEDKYTDPKYRQNMGQELFNALSRFDQLRKADALFKVFAAYIRDEINYQQFSQYSYILQNIDLNNLRILTDFYYSEKYLMIYFINHQPHGHK
ncbi:hypothetical protein H6G54_17170 [Anabaena cylindrica FACHB-243]|uniref:Uncharacterized protein n=1 Tax=Anabaena cylindrica (strain ATCC 27899 / PCC 7122) TaxID=272123 RepID=K9ZES0_ANACC|nr:MULTISPECIES: hypothetical protein [Anabaena]AFZ57688.1 hypothetical protein Anacy_2228 [Anabaena cylindrica PCC 7122]MBD2419398.1 hypothetical protein [Anabaena cylindrica FACHB-243]MBY5280598.1 hypothetical protein [Anabaena sp. CCAP 1446/1C]MBY5307862.1 hypothetical protein [Anabaena sp. CCAP 1446/1C]MCM2407566.1 hypothetical protein [Anabaena sp. CCAP 1446/1C]